MVVVVVGAGAGGGGGGWEEAGLVIAAPFPTQLLRFHLTFVTRFVFLLLVYLHMRRGRKGSLFQSPFDNFRENRNRFFFKLSNDVQKEDLNNSSSKGVVFTLDIS